MKFLVIGYGNTLRSDDGAGFYIAEQVAAWNLEHIRSLSRHQLTPELADDIAHNDVVIFVDAIATHITPNVTIDPLEPDANDSVAGHHITPRSLLGLAQTLYGASPKAHQVLIPAVEFGFGETLSDITQIHCETALRKIKELTCA